MSSFDNEGTSLEKGCANLVYTTIPDHQYNEDSKPSTLCDLSNSYGYGTQSASGTSPCINRYPGIHDFQVELSETSNSRRSWVYSSKLGKVFVDINKILLFQIKLNTNVVSNLRVRALLVYTDPDHNHLSVNRCMLHAFQSDPNYLVHIQDNVCNCSQLKLAGHVVRSNHTEAFYEYNSASGRHSVIVPLERPQAGSECIMIGYQFACKTSCEGGMSRRPVSLVFTLENKGGEVLGRSSMLVKVCSCPKRDKDREESDLPVEPECNNDKLRGVKRKLDDSLDDELECESFDSSTPDNSYYGFLSLFNQIEKMSELMRQSVETQKKQIEEAHRSTDEIMSAIEELTSRINDSNYTSDQASDE